MACAAPAHPPRTRQIGRCGQNNLRIHFPRPKMGRYSLFSSTLAAVDRRREGQGGEIVDLGSDSRIYHCRGRVRSNVEGT